MIVVLSEGKDPAPSLHEALQRAGLLGCTEEGSADRQGHHLDPFGAWRWRHAARFCFGFFGEDF